MTKRFSVARWEYLKLESSGKDKIDYTLIADLLVDDKDPSKNDYKQSFEKLMKQKTMKEWNGEFRSLTYNKGQDDEFKILLLAYPLDEIKIVFIVWAAARVASAFDPGTIMLDFKTEFTKLNTDHALIRAKKKGQSTYGE